MKKNHLLALCIAIIPFIYSCNNDPNSVMNNPATNGTPGDTNSLPKFQWESDLHEFGTIVQGEKVAHTFRFKNVGKSDLVITDATATCGCTKPEYDKKPVPPGGSGTIDVIFNSGGKEGHQDKKITVMANTNPSTVILRITGEVEVPNLKTETK